MKSHAENFWDMVSEYVAKADRPAGVRAECANHVSAVLERVAAGDCGEPELRSIVDRVVAGLDFPSLALLLAAVGVIGEAAAFKATENKHDAEQN